MKITMAALALLLPLYAFAASDHAISDDGREIELRADGSWQYLSTDRFATLPDGRRIRLHEDGTWTPVDEIDAERYNFSQKAGFSRDVVETEDNLRAEIRDFIVERVRTSRHKNSQLEARMVVTLTVTANGKLSASPEPTYFVLSDNRGRTYVTEQVIVSKGNPSAEDATTLTVVVKGAPRWWGVKYFSLELQAGAIGNNAPLTMTKIRGEVTERDVKAFSALQ